MAKIKIMIIY